MQHESLMERELRLRPIRPLPIALARVMANTKPGDPRMAAYNRLFTALPPVDQLRCRDEIHWCHMAKRGNVEAMVS